MRKILLKKSLVYGIIVLFLGLGIMPIFGSLTMEKRVSSPIQLGKNGSRNDTTPPVTTATLDPPEPNVNGWYACDVWVTLNATDNESGIKVTYYYKDNQWQIYTGPFNLFEDCPSTWFFSVDNAGNVETPRTLNLKNDQTDPIINLSVKIRLNNCIFVATCNDERSGMDRVEFYISGCVLYFIDTDPPYELGPPLPIDYLPVIGKAFDKAGNSASDSVSTPYVQSQSQNQQSNNQHSNTPNQNLRPLKSLLLKMLH